MRGVLQTVFTERRGAAMHATGGEHVFGILKFSIAYFRLMRLLGGQQVERKNGALGLVFLRSSNTLTWRLFSRGNGCVLGGLGFDFFFLGVCVTVSVTGRMGGI